MDLLILIVGVIFVFYIIYEKFDEAETDRIKAIEQAVKFKAWRIWLDKVTDVKFEEKSKKNFCEIGEMRERIRNEAGVEPTYMTALMGVMAQKGKIPFGVAGRGLTSPHSYVSFTGKGALEAYFKFARWYDIELRKNGVEYPLLYFYKRLQSYSEACELAKAEEHTLCYDTAAVFTWEPTAFLSY